jgi:hypothetical protein
MMKMWYPYTVGYYSVIKKSEIMSFTGKWMELEIIRLSEIRPTQKEKYCMFSLVKGTLLEKDQWKWGREKMIEGEIDQSTLKVCKK